MKITIMALGSRGDIQPYAELGGALCRAGHTVTFLATGDFAPIISDRGMNFNEIPGDSRRAVASAGARTIALMKAFRDISAAYIDLGPSLISLLAESDLILNQLPGSIFSVDVTEKYGVPTWQVATIPLVPTSEFPMMGFPGWPEFLPGYNRTTYSLAELLGAPLIAGLVNRWRRSRLELSPLPWARMGALTRARVSRSLIGVSPHVVSRPPDWGPNVHLTGYWRPPKQDWTPPPELL